MSETGKKKKKERWDFPGYWAMVERQQDRLDRSEYEPRHFGDIEDDGLDYREIEKRVHEKKLEVEKRLGRQLNPDDGFTDGLIYGEIRSAVWRSVKKEHDERKKKEAKKNKKKSAHDRKKAAKEKARIEATSFSIEEPAFE